MMDFYHTWLKKKKEWMNHNECKKHPLSFVSGHIFLWLVTSTFLFGLGVIWGRWVCVYIRWLSFLNKRLLRVVPQARSNNRGMCVSVCVLVTVYVQRKQTQTENMHWRGYDSSLNTRFLYYWSETHHWEMLPGKLHRKQLMMFADTVEVRPHGADLKQKIK